MALLSALLLSGCANTSAPYYYAYRNPIVEARDTLLGTQPTTGELYHDDSTPLTLINYDAADYMMGQFTSPLNKQSPIYLEPFTNRVNVNDPSPFGALISEQISSRLAQRRFMVTLGPPKKSTPPPKPEPAISSEESSPSNPESQTEPREKVKPEDLPRPCLLSGTYLIADKVIYISSRIVALDDGQVMAAHSWTVPVNRNTRALLPQLKQTGGMKPAVRTQLKGNAHKIANPSGQPQNYVDRDLVR